MNRRPGAPAVAGRLTQGSFSLVSIFDVIQSKPAEGSLNRQVNFLRSSRQIHDSPGPSCVGIMRGGTVRTSQSHVGFVLFAFPGALTSQLSSLSDNCHC